MKALTEEWFEKRKECITSTDVAVILGLTPKTQRELWQEKKGIIPAPEANDAMKHGADSEPKARNRLTRLVGITLQPKVMFHKEHSHFMASLDGIDFNERRGCEIKCPFYRASYEKLCATRKPSDIHYAQMQWQMYVSGIKAMIYFVYWSDEDFFCTEVLYDEKYINEIMPEINDFYMCLVNDVEPEDKWIRADNTDCLAAAEKFIKGKNMAEEGALLQKEAKTELLEFSDYKPIQCGNLRIDVIKRKGSIDYKSIPELQNVDLEKYRKPDMIVYQANLKKSID